MAEQKYYDWPATFSRQTGQQGEICIVVGAKDIGKTFGLRKQCVTDYIKRGDRFCEICRTVSEKKDVQRGYFDKLQNEGYFTDWMFKTEAGVGYISKRPEPWYDEDGKEHVDKPDWQVICYFVALTNFQAEKKRTYLKPKRYIFDEAIIDKKDKYHRYLSGEYLILANLLDTISRQQPGGYQYRVYILGNACDLTAPYFRYCGINKIPEFGYSFWKRKTVLLHYVEPWDKEERQTKTLVGRMLAGLDESEMVFGNVFDEGDSGTIAKKTANANYVYALRYAGYTYAVWIDYGTGLTYICSKVPKNAANIISLTKEDATLDYKAVERGSSYLQILSKFFYLGVLRYESPALRETFLNVLDFLGVR